MNEHLDWDLYFSQLKKKLNCGIELLAKIRHFTPKQLLKTLYFSLFNSNLIYGCQIWGQDQNEEFKKIEKLPEKAIRITNFLPLNTPVKKQMYEMISYTKTKGLHHASKYLICICKRLPE